MKIADFFVAIGLDADQKGLDNFTNGIEKLDKGLKLLKIAAVTFAVERLTSATVKASVAVNNFNQQTGLMGDTLRQWQIASELSDITLSAESVATSIASLQQNLTAIRLGSGNVAPFQMLGIDTTNKGAFDILEDVRQQIKGLDSATAVNLIEQMGLTPQFIQVLRLSKQEFNDLFSGKNMLNKEQTKAVVDMGTAFTSFKISLITIKDQIVAGVAPAFTVLAKVLTSIADGLAFFTSVVTKSQNAMRHLLVVGSALLAFFAPLTATITAVILVIDDLVTALQGGDSVIGDMYDGIKWLGKAIYDSLIVPINIFMSRFEKLKESIKGIISSGGDFVGDIKGGAEDLAGGIASGTKNAWGAISNSFSNVFNINSNADAQSIANNVATLQQRDLNYALSEINNGAVS